MTAPYKSQQNGTAERVNRTLMERVRAALLDAGAEEEPWAEALAAVVHVLIRSPKAGQDVTPFEALNGRRPNVEGFRVWGSRAWALKPKKQQRKLEARTDVGRFVGYTVGGKAYRILEDDTNQVIERRDVIMEENKPEVTKESSAAGPSVRQMLATTDDGGDDDGPDGTDTASEIGASSGGEHQPDYVSGSDDYDEAPHHIDDREDEGDDVEAASTQGYQAPPGSPTGRGRTGEAGPRRSKRKPAPMVSWWLSKPEALLACRDAGVVKDDFDLSKAPANEKEARARPDWPL